MSTRELIDRFGETLRDIEDKLSNVPVWKEVYVELSASERLYYGRIKKGWGFYWWSHTGGSTPLLETTLERKFLAVEHLEQLIENISRVVHSLEPRVQHALEKTKDANSRVDQLLTEIPSDELRSSDPAPTRSDT